MYIHTSHDSVGQPTSGIAGLEAADRLVRKFTCSQADLDKVNHAARKTADAAAVKTAIAAAIEKAISLTKKAIRELEKTPRTTATRTLFREIFSTFPEYTPKWAAGASWKDLGGLVALRLQRAAEVLAGGKVQYHCWGCPGGDRDPSTYDACNHPCGKLVIGLGQGFWEFWGTDDVERMAMTLLHEALHVYYCANIKDAGNGRYGNIYCYQRFVPEINGLDLYPQVEKACASVLRRGSRGREVRKLQNMLNHWYYQLPVTMTLEPELTELEVTGVFDRQTEKNVKIFQRKNGLDADGVAGSDTWRSLLQFNP
jgi:hypothetical protein